jgi:hypothetical protein
LENVSHEFTQEFNSPFRPESMPDVRNWYCMGKEMIRLYLDDANYKPLEVDLIAKLFEGLSVKIKAGLTGKPYINLGRKLNKVNNPLHCDFSYSSCPADIRLTFVAILCLENR